MPFAFSEVCTLLERHEETELRRPPLLKNADHEAQTRAVTESWFKSHRSAIAQLGADSSVALLSTLLPERRTDRVYNIKAPRLCLILSRCLGLSAARAKDLQAYTQPGRGDLATCLERVLSSCGPPAWPVVSLDEVYEMLHVLAGGCRFSDPSIARLPPGSSESRDTLIGNILKRLQPRDAKWLVRLTLKDLTPARLNESQILKSFHFMLPNVLRFQDRFDAALGLLKGPLAQYPSHSDPRSESLHFQSAAKFLVPTRGVKVGRPNFHKARSIDHCIHMLSGTHWVLERKYDGEYCEIHIDMTKKVKHPCEYITIFSKSGKNSTSDRKALHQTLVDTLRLGKPDCKIKLQAIVLGEMVVYSDTERCIRPFDEIRKHVLRSGRAIGTDVDSCPKPGEHLAIVFFDLLLLDDEIVLNRPVDERRQWLRVLYEKIGGHAMGAEWKMVDFSTGSVAKRRLMEQFAASIAQRCEGLVLKPCGVPYFSLDVSPRSYSQSYIKLKKDYIIGMGDEADFAIIGGSYNAQQAATSGVAGIKWTDFHLGCLINKTDVARFDARPRFKVVGTIQQDHCVPTPILQAANALGMFCARPYKADDSALDFDIEATPAATRIDSVFETPFVFEVLGAGFEKPSNCNFYTLRHARVTKLHEDRSWKDAVSMQELQEQAVAARSAAADSDSEETKRWLRKLENKSRRKFEREGTETPRSRTTATPSTAMMFTGRSKRSLNTVHRDRTSRGKTASPSTSALDGTTLIEHSLPTRSKRVHDEAFQTPCPARKRSRVEQDGHNGSARSKAAPLSDITNQAPTFSTLPVRSTVREPEIAADAQNTKTCLKGLCSFIKSSPTAAVTSEHCCSGKSCPLHNSTLHISNCIRHTPYITSNLLSCHLSNDCCALTSSLEHWERDAFAFPPLMETVSESPACKGRKKIVLVEGRRRDATTDIVRKVSNLGLRHERIEVWDWRVLERGRSGDKGGSEDGLPWFLGTVEYDEFKKGRFEWLGGMATA